MDFFRKLFSGQPFRDKDITVSQYASIEAISHRMTSNELTWWRHQMEKFSALLALCVGKSPATDEIPAQRPVTRSFDVFVDLCLE